MTSSTTQFSASSEEYLSTYKVLKFLSGIVILAFLVASFVGVMMIREIQKLTDDRELALMEMSRELQEVRDTLKVERDQTLVWRKYVDEKLKSVQSLQEKSIQKTEESHPGLKR